MSTPRSKSNTDFTQSKSRILGAIGGGCLALMLAGCSTPSKKVVVKEVEYTRVVTTDFRGRVIAEYVAEGSVKREEEGTRFKAVERHIQKPHPRVIRYPLGRMVTVNAPNLLLEPTVKPAWLHRLDQ